MKQQNKYLLAIITVVFSTAIGCSAQHMPDHNQHSHDADVIKNGEKAMGFSQTATNHHFLLLPDGGAIRVETNEANDSDNRSLIRKHLTEIARQFGEGEFATPFAVHGKVPDGVPTMERLKSKIKYVYKETPNGASVSLSTEDANALAAIHEFLRFQINDHKTGDPLEPAIP